MFTRERKFLLRETLNIAFKLQGHVPHYLMQRAKYAERCGLWHAAMEEPI